MSCISIPCGRSSGWTIRRRIDLRITIATRGSRLALAQTELVAAALRDTRSDVEIDVLEVTTRGDRDPRPFSEIGGKGLFMSEVERALIEGRADAAVHSAKDLTAELGPECTIACIPGRADPRDVVLGGMGDNGEARLGRLESGTVVGTSSMRRRSLLAEMRPDLEIAELRGNIDTRVRKVAEGTVAVAILAAAGLDRLRDLEADYAPLDPARWVPAPAQGALAVETLAERRDVIEIFEALNDESARAEIECERAFAARLEGGCSVPLGCLARVDGADLVATGFLGDPAGGQALRDRISGPASAARELGGELAAAILSSGGDDILAEIERHEDEVSLP